ncbi:MAG: sporulation integral membrane protein YtvI [Oscillospiraceae bacterium]|nr:sporulation integral membrane protein YtvI [Oscillospiraceae bacterium]
MDKKKQYDYIVRIAFWLCAAVTAYIAIKFCLPVASPFITAFIFSVILKPASSFFSHKIGIKYKAASALTVIAFFTIIAVIAVGAGARLVSALFSWITHIPEFYEQIIAPSAAEIMKYACAIAEKLNPSVSKPAAELFDKIIEALYSALSSICAAAAQKISSVASSSVPRIILSVMTTVTATYYLTSDAAVIRNFLKAQISPKAWDILTRGLACTGKAALKYIRSYALIMLITFAELSVGLAIIRVNSPFISAFLIALFDILPVVGSGGILVPWAILMFIRNDTATGTGLIAVYVTVSVVRSLIEPKIIGVQTGLHPLAALAGMFAGASLFGITGLIAGPLVLAIIKNLNENGIFRIYRESTHQDSNCEKKAS